MVYPSLYRVIPLSLALPMMFLEVGVTLPPPEDIPEEVLRMEIITEGRSPVDGEPLTAAEYAQLQEKLAQSPYPPEIDSKLQNLIFLLKIRKMLKTFVPLPIIP
ncbi:hypothetical protein [Crocosphaera sp.]|uniref:hypothetical protein n=1 Tax=Crocosphaera sp. TaxID=2729996 RepID=UPI003F23AF1D|nr:hypothetical protein [Crocosphaera sp.]